MSGKDSINVLAVLDRAVKDAQDRVPFMPPEGTFDADHQFAYEEAGSAYMELREARAAIAELIAAVKARRVTPMGSLWVAAFDREGAALARCGGAK